MIRRDLKKGRNPQQTKTAGTEDGDDHRYHGIADPAQRADKYVHDTAQCVSAADHGRLTASQPKKVLKALTGLIFLSIFSFSIARYCTLLYNDIEVIL